MCMTIQMKLLSSTFPRYWLFFYLKKKKKKKKKENPRNFAFLNLVTLQKRFIRLVAVIDFLFSVVNTVSIC